jgi:hypothetical protein
MTENSSKQWLMKVYLFLSVLVRNYHNLGNHGDLSSRFGRHKTKIRLNMMIQAYNSGTWEAEEAGQEFNAMLRSIAKHNNK